MKRTLYAVLAVLNILRCGYVFVEEHLGWVQERLTRDGILGNQFDKRLESFAPCNSYK
jgi:hypothetical protein